MSALNNQTNRNSGRYFFATAEDGEQTLGLQYGTTGGAAPISTMAVTISGTQGNGVIVSEAPCYLATEFMLGEDAMMGGTNSTYNTLSSINTTLSGFNISKDRVPGSGRTTIESYNTNGVGGFEFLNRGVNSALTSTMMDSWFSAQGAPGATATLFPNGDLATGRNLVTNCGISLAAQTGGGGAGSWNIADLSGGIGRTRWSIFKYGIETGGNTGTNLALGAYNDNGSFNSNVFTATRATGAMAITNLSSITNQVSTGTYANVFPCTKDNTEFGIPGANNTAPITGALSVLFSTPVANLNPNTQSLVNINFANAISSASKYVDYKIGFSTATAYTNILQTAYLPGGGWTPGGAPSTIGNTNICCILDPDGLNPNGTGFLYVAGRTLDGSTDTIYIDKGLVTEPTRNALCYRPI